ncbi:MAG TPA: hypothetical protein VGT24_11035 [Candidatus Acidoferrales bacterium]|nr:hypothetical protein [Candidatus Acidoferrales bacterium]
MKIGKAIIVVFVFNLVAALGVLAPVTHASELDEATQLTFDQPVHIPGNVVLQPGTYWFALANPTSSHDVVNVFDENWKPITTIMATSTELSQPSDDTLLTFAKISPDKPEVLLKWYYPGNAIGHEFVYSGAEGRTLSEETKNIVTVTGQTTDEVPAQGAMSNHY